MQRHDDVRPVVYVLCYWQAVLRTNLPSTGSRVLPASCWLISVLSFCPCYVYIHMAKLIFCLCWCLSSLHAPTFEKKIILWIHNRWRRKWGPMYCLYAYVHTHMIHKHGMDACMHMHSYMTHYTRAYNTYAAYSCMHIYAHDSCMCMCAGAEHIGQVSANLLLCK